MDALEAIKTRRSTRKFKEDMPPRELLDKIIEAGRYAPSGHNSQTTHLIVITDKNLGRQRQSVKTKRIIISCNFNTYSLKLN